MSSGISLRNITSIGSASQAQLDFVTSKFSRHPKSIKEQYLEDCATLDKLEITHQQIVDKCTVLFLKSMYLLANHNYTNQREVIVSAVIEGKFEVTGFALRRQCEPDPCPFTIQQRRPCGFGGIDFAIKNLTTNESIQTSDMQMHIIEVHHFFARVGTPSRLDPTLACRVLELSPGVDYSEDILTTATWENTSSTGYKGSTCPEAHKKNLEALAVAKMSIDPYTTAYLMKTRYVEPDPKPEPTGSSLEWRKFLINTDDVPCEDDPEVEEEGEYLHIVGGKEGFMKKMTVFGKTIDSLFGEKDHLSVLKPGTKKSAIASFLDHLKFRKP